VIELPFVFMAGILGSAHCLGMCGPFTLAIAGGSRSLGHNVARQSIYSCGRVFTYAFLGAAAGFGGWRLSPMFPALVNLPAMLAIVAGGFLIYQGLAALNLLPKKLSVGHGNCLAGSMFKTFLTGRSHTQVFLAGMLTGFLPCGLLYGMLTLAASTQHVGYGMLLMIVFGFGTVPIMMLLGSGSSILSFGSRQCLYKAAAWCVMIAGILSMARGFGFIQIEGLITGGGCPMCNG